MDPILVRVLVVAALVAVAVIAGRWWQRRDGRVRGAGDAALTAAHLASLGLDLDDASAGAVLLGTDTCAPCESVKRVLRALEAERDDFRWVYADAADHHELVQEHRVMRVPTLLVVSRSGRLVARTSGVPKVDDLRRVLDEPRSLSEPVA